MDFTHQFWIYFIGVVTIVGFVSVIALAHFNRKTSSAVGETTGHVWDEDLMEYDNPLPVWWLYLLYLTVAFSVGYLLLYPGVLPNGGLLKWTQIKQYEAEVAATASVYASQLDSYANLTPVELSKNEPAMKTASRLFSQSCAVCHGSDARGAPSIPNLRDDDWIYGSDPQTILTTILDGRKGFMPGWEIVLGGPESTLDVSHYVLELSGQNADAERAARGKPKFKMICIACHGADGSGIPMLGGMNLTDNVWVHGNSLEEIRNIVANGVTNEMPAHKDLLGETKSKLLAGYVISLSN